MFWGEGTPVEGDPVNEAGDSVCDDIFHSLCKVHGAGEPSAHLHIQPTHILICILSIYEEYNILLFCPETRVFTPWADYKLFTITPVHS